MKWLADLWKTYIPLLKNSAKIELVCLQVFVLCLKTAGNGKVKSVAITVTRVNCH